MKIIKQGALPEEKVIRATCSHCSTLFEFKVGEAKFESSPRNESFYVVNCPFCHKQMYVDADTRPYQGGILENH